MLVGYTAGTPTMGPDSINRAAREILSVRSRRHPWRTVLRRAFPAAILLAVAVGALSWFGIAGKSSQAVGGESSAPPDVAVGPPSAAAIEAFSVQAEKPTAEVEAVTTDWKLK
jgi:hypothetical protein